MASTGGSAYLNTSRCLHKLSEEDLESVKGRKMRAQRGEGYAWTQEQAQAQGNLGSAGHEDGNVVQLFFLLFAAAARFLQRGERLAQGEQGTALGIKTMWRRSGLESVRGQNLLYYILDPWLLHDALRLLLKAVQQV